MKGLRIGVTLMEPSARSIVDRIARLEELGIDAAWLPNLRPDALAVLAVAATRTERIALGTSIIPTYPRHPLVMAQGAKAVAEFAPGRFRLGIGPSHAPLMGMWGIEQRSPISHLREYVQVVQAALQQGGQLQFDGRFFKINDVWGWGEPVSVPVMISALRRKSFELAGEIADGAISWVCPLPYMENIASPALNKGAEGAGRKRPPLVMHTGVCVHEDSAEVLEGAGKLFGVYPTLPFYRQMFLEAGFPEAAEGKLSERMVNAIVLSGGENIVADRVREIATAGIDEVICSIVPAGGDPAGSIERSLRLLAELAKS